MDKVKVLIVEDEVIIADHIADHLEGFGYEVIGPALNYSEAISEIEEFQPDIGILDITLNGKKNGMDLAEVIRSKYHFPFIFLTSHSDKATLDKAKMVEPSAFLVKPYSVEDLFASIEIALFNFSQQSERAVNESNLIIHDALFIKQSRTFHRIDFTSILYLQSDHVYIDIYTVEGKKTTVRGTLRDYIQRLTKDFVQCHRGYIINLKHLNAIDYTTVTLKDQVVPLGKTFREEILGRLKLG